MRDITVRYKDGDEVMTIHPDQFLRYATITQFKKFLKIVDEDWNNRDRVLSEIESDILDLILMEPKTAMKDRLKKKYREVDKRRYA